MDLNGLKALKPSREMVAGLLLIQKGARIHDLMKGVTL